MIQERRSYVAKEGRITDWLLFFFLSRKKKCLRVIFAVLMILVELLDRIQIKKKYKNI